MIIPFLSDTEFYYLLYFLVILVAAVYFGAKNRGKILVRIKTHLHDENYVWAKPTKDGKKLRIRKAVKGKDLGWTPEIDPNGIMTHKTWFGLRTIKTLDIIREAPKTIGYMFNPENVTQPILSKEDAAKLNATDGFRRRYGDKPAGAGGSWIFYAILIVSIVGLILQLRSQGIINF